LNENLKKLFEAQGIQVKTDGLYPTTGIDTFGLLMSGINECITVLEGANATAEVEAIKAHFGLN
jgi:hypothetical protein